MNKFTWPSVALVAALGAVACVLAVLTDMSAGDIIAVLGILGAVGGGAVAGGALAGGVGARVDQLHAETAAQTTQLTTIEKNTNGQADAERQDIAERAAAAVLRQQGGH